MIFVAMVFFVIAYSSQKGITYTPGAPAGYTNSPYDNKTCTQCHQHAGAPHFREGLIHTDVPLCGYVPGETYTVTLSIQSAVTNRFGFICSPHDSTGNLLGNLIITDTNRTHIVGQNYVTHKSAGVNGVNNQQNWSFDWTAPFGEEQVTFYAAFTAGQVLNDSTFTTRHTIFDEAFASTKNKNILKDVVAFPNPFDEWFYIKTPSTLTPSKISCSVYDTKGRLMDVFSLEDNLTPIEMSSYPPGVYILSIENNTSANTMKVIKTSH